MANITVNWGSFAFVTYSTGTDIDGISLTDGNTIVTDAIDMIGTISKELALTIVAPNSALTDAVTLTVLRQVGSSYQDPATSHDNYSRYSVPITQNETTLWAITLRADELSSCKIEIDNQSGVTLTVSLEEADSNLVSA